MYLHLCELENALSKNVKKANITRNNTIKER